MEGSNFMLLSRAIVIFAPLPVWGVFMYGMALEDLCSAAGRHLSSQWCGEGAGAALDSSTLHALR